MDKIYILTYSRKKKNPTGSLIGQIDQDLFHMTIEKKIEDNQIHRYLKKSFLYCTIKPGDKPLSALFKYGKVYKGSETTGYRLIELPLIPGSFYPRIYRPFIEEGRLALNLNSSDIEKLKEEVFQYSDYFPQDNKVILSAVNQLSALKEMLISIFNTAYPSSQNLKTFGHSIKNLLVLSCIEVETQLKGIYRANETTSKKNYTTNNYVDLKSIMQLDKYEVRFPFYPDLKLISPFKKWSRANPTTSLKWYDDYNAIKHNSELDFSRATLESAISAICAVAILIKAQYGNYIPFWDEEIGSFFEVKNNTDWKIEEMLLPPITNWSSKKIGL